MKKEFTGNTYGHDYSIYFDPKVGYRKCFIKLNDADIECIENLFQELSIKLGMYHLININDEIFIEFNLGGVSDLPDLNAITTLGITDETINAELKNRINHIIEVKTYICYAKGLHPSVKTLDYAKCESIHVINMINFNTEHAAFAAL